MIGAAFGLGFIVGPGLGGLLTQPQMGRIGYQLPIFLASALAAPAAFAQSAPAGAASVEQHAAAGSSINRPDDRNCVRSTGSLIPPKKNGKKPN